MNTQSAKKALEFATIVRSDSDGTIVRVPGHNGRVYFVKVTEHSVTCKQPKSRNGRNCPSVGSGTICYHGLAAYEKVYGPVSWCEREEDAARLGNLGKHTVEVHSTQGRARAWAVLNGKGDSAEARQAKVVALAREYIDLYNKQQKARLSDIQYQRLVECRRQIGILKLSHKEIVELAKEIEPEDQLVRGRAVLRSDEDWEEAI